MFAGCRCSRVESSAWVSHGKATERRSAGDCSGSSRQVSPPLLLLLLLLLHPHSWLLLISLRRAREARDP